MQRWFVWLGVASLAFGLWLMPRASRACSCLPPRPPAEALEDADVVFEGHAEAAELEGDVLRVPFVVVRVWKGDPAAHVDVITATNSAACGRNYEAAERYLVYASIGDDDDLVDNLCTRTRLAEDASEDFAVLGEGRPVGAPSPSPGDEPVVEPPRIDDAPAVPPVRPSKRGCTVDPGSTHAIAALLGVVLVARRRRREKD